MRLFVSFAGLGSVEKIASPAITQASLCQKSTLDPAKTHVYIEMLCSECVL